jgi:hypothetical protein
MGRRCILSIGCGGERKAAFDPTVNIGRYQYDNMADIMFSDQIHEYQ